MWRTLKILSRNSLADRLFYGSETSKCRYFQHAKKCAKRKVQCTLGKADISRPGRTSCPLGLCVECEHALFSDNNSSKLFRVNDLLPMVTNLVVWILTHASTTKMRPFYVRFNRKRTYLWRKGRRKNECFVLPCRSVYVHSELKWFVWNLWSNRPERLLLRLEENVSRVLGLLHEVKKHLATKK